MTGGGTDRARMRYNDDIPGLIGDLIRKGLIDTVDLDADLATVRIGDVVSPPLRWVTIVGGWIVRIPPTVGASVCILCPDGDIEAAIILNGLHTDVFPPLGLGAMAALKAPDNTLFSYDPDTHTLTLDLAAGKLVIKAPADVEITGTVNITGDVAVTGKIEATDDVTADGISLTGHVHGNVQTGIAKTGEPE